MTEDFDDKRARGGSGSRRRESLAERIDRLHREDRHEVIVRMLEAADRDALEPGIVSRWGRALNNLGRYGEAERVLRTVEREGRDDAEWNFRMGFALYWGGRPEEALGCFERAGELDPEDEEAQDYAEDCRQALASRERLLPEELVERCRELGEEGRFMEMREAVTGYLEEGAARGWFTEEEGERDLEAALLIAYANGNIDEYVYYFDSVLRLERVEDKAAGCGTWFYRYSLSLMRVGRLREARTYAERGTREEPGYPWIWLQAAKLRAHFGRKAEALAAVEEGLRLVPGDYEFGVLREEIERGATIEEMENHYINEEDDRRLREGGLSEEERRAKLSATDSIVCDVKGLEAVLNAVDPETWEPDAPYCMGTVEYEGEELPFVFEMNEAALSKVDPAWAGRLFSSLGELDAAAGRWLRERVNPVGKDEPLTLMEVRVGWERWVELEYEEGHSVRFTEGLEVDPLAQVNYDPTVYSEEERRAVLSHVECYFGHVANVYAERVSPDIRLDIYVVEPTPERNFYTLVTCGAGAARMTPPEGASARQYGRMELVMCLPPEWRLDSEEERWYWPVRCLKTLGRLPGECGLWLGAGFTFGHEEPMAEGVPFSGAVLLDAQEEDERSCSCRLSGGDQVNFYEVVPLFPQELALKVRRGLDAMLDAMRDVSRVVDPGRRSAVASYEEGERKRYFIAPERMKPLLADWFEGDACRASDRIIVEGRRVGYMYRVRPRLEGVPDSGWRFVAGDENREYMADPSNMGTYSLNTLCNYDPDIIPLLNSPCGTAYYRDAEGRFHREDFDEGEGEA